MRIAKKAFTLAEVLIALTVTGVIAAFIIPQTVTSIQKQQAGLKLAKTVQQIELGCRNYIEYANEQESLKAAKQANYSQNGATEPQVRVISHYTAITQIPDFSMDKFASFLGLKRDKIDITINAIKNYVSYNSSILPAAYAAVNGSAGEDLTVEDDIENNKKGIGSQSHLCNDLVMASIACPDDDEQGSDDDGPGSDDGVIDLPNHAELDPCLGLVHNPLCARPGDIVVGTTNSGSAYRSVKGNVGVYFSKAVDTEVTMENGTITSLFIDVNGFGKAPDMFGKDVFVFDLNNSGKMVPRGLNSYKQDCSDTNIKDGKACTARVVAEGYKINY